MTERTDFIATLQACYFGDKNAFEKVLRIYDEKQDRIDKAIEYVELYTEITKVDNVEFPYELKELHLSTGCRNTLLEILKGGNNEC